MRLTLSGDVHPVGNFLQSERPKCQGKVMSARLCLHEAVGNIYIQFIPQHYQLLVVAGAVRLSSSSSRIGSSGLTVFPSNRLQLPFWFTIFPMYVRPRLPKIVPDLAEMCYAIDLFYFTFKFAINIFSSCFLKLLRFAHTLFISLTTARMCHLLIQTAAQRARRSLYKSSKLVFVTALLCF